MVGGRSSVFVLRRVKFDRPSHNGAGAESDVGAAQAAHSSSIREVAVAGGALNQRKTGGREDISFMRRRPSPPYLEGVSAFVRSPDLPGGSEGYDVFDHWLGVSEVPSVVGFRAREWSVVVRLVRVAVPPSRSVGEAVLSWLNLPVHRPTAALHEFFVAVDAFSASIPKAVFTLRAVERWCFPDGSFVMWLKSPPKGQVVAAPGEGALDGPGDL